MNESLNQNWNEKALMNIHFNNIKMNTSNSCRLISNKFLFLLKYILMSQSDMLACYSSLFNKF